MPNFQRNIRLVSFLFLPICGFLLGWTLNQKIQTPPPIEKKIEKTEIPVFEIPIKTRTKSTPKNVDLSIFWETWNLMEKNFLYPEKLKTKNQIYGAARGLVTSLEDPYTVFMDPTETHEFEESINGEFEGIGAEIAIKENQLTIVAPLKGSPAELAGLKAGDKIFKINDEPTFGISISKAVTKIRGPKGEKVMLTILRENQKKPLEITIVRDTIVLENLKWEIKNNVAIIELSQFGTDSAIEFQKIIEKILTENPRGIILDLRNNGGGLLDVCVKIATEFFDQKIIVKTKGRKFGDTGDIVSGANGKFLKIPLIVLINRGSASASEIFAGAVKDHNRGLLLGEKTFGKGSVQNVIPLSDGSSLKVTIAEWLTPHEKSIHEIGISPDEKIEITDDDFENDRDPVLSRALDLVGTEEMQKILENKNKKISKKNPTFLPHFDNSDSKIFIDCEKNSDCELIFLENGCGDFSSINRKNEKSAIKNFNKKEKILLKNVNFDCAAPKKIENFRAICREKICAAEKIE